MSVNGVAFLQKFVCRVAAVICLWYEMKGQSLGCDPNYVKDVLSLGKIFSDNEAQHLEQLQGF